MRKQTWIRFGLSSVILTSAGLACLGVGCSGDDTGPAAATDSGADHTNTFPDSGDTGTGGDTGGDTGTDAGAKHAKIIAVHASPNAPSLRFCFAVGVKADGSDGVVGPLPALPHDDSNLPTGVPFPALYTGTGGAFPDLTDLEPKALTPIVIPMPNAAIATDVKSNPNERTCDTLVGASGTGGVLHPIGADGSGDFFKLGTIPVGTFKKGNTYLLALTGCLPGDTSQSLTGNNGKAKCGAAYDNTVGNVGLRILQLDKTVADAAKLGLQVLHLAQPVDGFVTLGSFATAAPFDLGVKNYIGLTRDDLDGGNPPNAPVANGVNYGSFDPDGGVAQPETYASTDYAHAVAYAKVVGFHTVPADPDAGTDASVAAIPAALIPLPFGVVQKLSYGSFDGGIGVGPAGAPIYLSGGNYTLIFLGDPTAAHQLTMTLDGGAVVPDPQYDGHGVHMMMFPNDPPLPSL